MTGIVLGPNEFVVSELTNVFGGDSIITKLFNVTLTNKRIIVSRIGAFGKSKFSFEKHISTVKVYNGEAQVKVASVYGTQTKIDIYLISEQLSFKMNGTGNTDAIRFANALNHVVTGTDVDIYSLSGNDTGMSAFKKAFFGISSAEAKKQVNQKVAIRCSSCGATFEGLKGRTAKCPFCGTIYNA